MLLILQRDEHFLFINMSEINIVDAPPGIEGSGFFATSLDKVIGLARSNSLWPLPFATSCCGIEFMATMGSHYDLGRFGAERLSFSPRQADVLMVMGTIAKKMAPVLKQVYIQMAEPRWVRLLVPAQVVVVFSILIPYCKVLMRLFRWMFTFRVVRQDLKPF